MFIVDKHYLIDMPSHDIHELIDEIFLGKRHPEVHKIMDLPALFVKKHHRRYFHDPLSILILFGNDAEKLSSAVLHILMDELVSDFKRSLRVSKKRAKRRHR